MVQILALGVLAVGTGMVVAFSVGLVMKELIHVFADL